MTQNRRHLAVFASVALLVGAGDFVSKRLAELWLAGRELPVPWLADAVRFAVYHNDRFAFGVGLGAYTWRINLAVTLGAIALITLVCLELAAVDHSAPVALGLIAGAALGNLVSLVRSPAGVIDFLAIDHGRGREIVLNLADIAAYVGLALMLRTAWSILAALRTGVEVRYQAAAALHADVSAPAPLRASEVEVGRLVFDERPRAAANRGDRPEDRPGDHVHETGPEISRDVARGNREEGERRVW